jgi:putative ABC transport system substrate-binding protein
MTELSHPKSEISKYLALSPMLYVLGLCGAVFFAFCISVEAHQPKQMSQIGYLSPHSGPPPTLAAFKDQLAELGWVEGKQVRFQYRYAGGQIHKYSEVATELVSLKVDAIVAGPGNAVPNAAKRATTTIPIVMVGVIDPVSNGLVASLAQPGANMTGLAWEVTREQARKNLEFLKEAVPKVSRVVILRNPNILTHIAYSKEAERAAKTLGVRLQFAEMHAPNNEALEDALGTVLNERANALLVTPHPFFNDRRQQILNFAAGNKLPAIYPDRTSVFEGGLMSYGPSGQDMWRRAAVYVDKILKGTKPADLPVEQPTKFELVINLKTAKQIGLTIPPNVLARADKVIK